MAKNDPIKPKGKGKKALNKLTAIIEETNGFKEQLKKARDSLIKLIKKRGEFEEIKPISKPKRRSMMYKTLPRIEFICNQLKFYIDFTMINSDSNDLIDIKGNIIYGANRTLCFTDCIFPVNNNNKKSNKECENCERIARCDRLEDKPLLKFTVNRNGLITSGGEIDDEWWIKEKEDVLASEDLLDLHLRALDFIWGKALDWTNENLLP